MGAIFEYLHILRNFFFFSFVKLINDYVTEGNNIIAPDVSLLYLAPLMFYCVGGCGIEPGVVATLTLAVRRSFIIYPQG
jgi:hypothetical protein